VYHDARRIFDPRHPLSLYPFHHRLLVSMPVLNATGSDGRARHGLYRLGTSFVTACEVTG
jgi:hypothetical protein